MKNRETEIRTKKTLQLKKRALSLGMDFFGVAPIKKLRQHFFQINSAAIEDCYHVLSMGVRISEAVLDDIQDKPTPLYLHHYRQCNYLLDRTAFSVAQMIQNDGYRAIPIAASQIVDWENQRAHVSHKAVAVEAGHGWLGRNNLLIHPTFGSQVRLVSIVTNAPLLNNKPLKETCGDCRACISVCPARAITDDQKQFNHAGCFEMLRFFKNKINIGHYICGICVRACNGKVKVKAKQG
jgi:epoxyqueuosine reductase QueG